MRSFLKKLTHPFLKKGLNWYYSRPRKYRYEDIEVLVHPDVFPPHLTLSTKVLLDFIQPLDFKENTFLELGCGSGIISLYAAKKGAIVTATDINKTALEYLKKAALKNNLSLELTFSDLFGNLQNRQFDHIFINPPYYPKKPKNTKEHAWFCGTDFEYFKKLFGQLPTYISEGSKVYMILSEDCKIDTIQGIASSKGLFFEQVQQKKVLGEINLIYLIKMQQ